MKSCGIPSKMPCEVCFILASRPCIGVGARITRPPCTYPKPWWPRHIPVGKGRLMMMIKWWWFVCEGCQSKDYVPILPRTGVSISSHANRLNPKSASISGDPGPMHRGTYGRWRWWLHLGRKMTWLCFHPIHFNQAVCPSSLQGCVGERYM